MTDPRIPPPHLRSRAPRPPDSAVRVAAVVTARGDSERLRGKHTADVCGFPLLHYPLRAAREAETVDTVAIASDSEEIVALGYHHGADTAYQIPSEHTRACSTQAEALAWTVSRLDADTAGALEIVVCLLGNTVMVDGALIDRAVRALDADGAATSVLSVWRAEDDHPLRAMELTPQGILVPFAGGSSPSYSDTRRYPAAYYHDQGVWVCRTPNFYRLDGLPPWTWAGQRPAAIVRPWWAGRDVDDAHDLALARLWVREGLG